MIFILFDNSRYVDNAKIALIGGFVIVIALSISLVLIR